MKFSKLLLLGALAGANVASAVVVEFYGTGTYETYNYDTSSFVFLPFSVGFSYNTEGAIVTTFEKQQLRDAVRLSLTVTQWDGTVWSHATDNVRITQNNATPGAYDGITISTMDPVGGSPADFLAFGLYYPVVNYSFELTEHSGGIFADGTFGLPASPTFIGDLANWEVKHAKLYVDAGGAFPVAGFNHPLTTLGAPAPIPEPSTWAAMIGAMALSLAVWNRRRAAKHVSG